MAHTAVLLTETLTCLNLKAGAVVVDGTLGNAGHSLAILKLIGEKGRLIALDQDSASLARCRPLLNDFPQASLHHENFANLEKILAELNICGVDAVLLDVGFSSDQVGDPARGFSFDADGPLDMRMNPEAPLTARDLVRDLSEEELEKLFSEYGEERWAGKFAHAIVYARERMAIETTAQLVSALATALPGRMNFQKGRRPSWNRRHFATRVFQALRIAVNDELGVLRNGLTAAWTCLAPGGRLAVITFHSLEDRIVKYQFRDWVKEGLAQAVTRKPVVAGRPEQMDNPRSRSAKLRTVEKML